MAYYYLDYNPADESSQFWTYKTVSFVTSLVLIFLLMTVSLKPWIFVCIAILAASLTMLFDIEGAFDYEGIFWDYFWRLFKIVGLVILFWILTWCAQMVKRIRNWFNGGEDENENENEDDESISVYASLGLIVIFALVLTWCVRKLQRPRRRRGI